MAPTKVTLRELTAEERQALEQLAASRTAQARFVERARILLAGADGRPPSQIAKHLGVSRPTVYTWIHRFNERGLGGLEDRPRAGRPHTYTAEQRAEVIAAALTDPKSLSLPFGCWTLDRLRAYLHEQKGIGIKRSRIGELLVDEGLKWRHQETWFGERVDPDFAEKRGSSSGSTPTRRRGASWSASTRWGRRVPRASRDSNSSTPRRSRTSAAPSPSPTPMTPRRNRKPSTPNPDQRPTRSSPSPTPPPPRRNRSRRAGPACRTGQARDRLRATR
jgi:transposase